MPKQRCQRSTFLHCFPQSIPIKTNGMSDSNVRWQPSLKWPMPPQIRVSVYPIETNGMSDSNVRWPAIAQMADATPNPRLTQSQWDVRFLYPMASIDTGKMSDSHSPQGLCKNFAFLFQNHQMQTSCCLGTSRSKTS